MTKRPHRAHTRHPGLRVVADERVPNPPVDRELRVRAFIRRGCMAATVAATLGLGWLLALVVVGVASRWWR